MGIHLRNDDGRGQPAAGLGGCTRGGCLWRAAEGGTGLSRGGHQMAWRLSELGPGKGVRQLMKFYQIHA